MNLKICLAALALAVAPMAAGAVTLLDPLPDSDSQAATFTDVDFAFSEDYQVDRRAWIEILYTGTACCEDNLSNMLFTSAELGLNKGFDVVIQIGELFEAEGFFKTTFGPGPFTISWTNGGNLPESSAQAGFTIIASPIPLPAAGWMLVSAVAGVGFLARRQRMAV